MPRVTCSAQASCVPGLWGSGASDLAPPSFTFALSAKTHQRPEVRAPSFSRVKVADIFHRLVSTPFTSNPLQHSWALPGLEGALQEWSTLPSPSMAPHWFQPQDVEPGVRILQAKSPPSMAALPDPL